MNIKLLGQESHLDTNNLQVEWSGVEDVKPELRGLSTGVVMVGASGTPYHDRLFFFNVRLPPS
jgi:hypothetical protein